ncbi:MAG: hypothetical protein M3336_07720, partial [Chloroflexota bacterium]|nr:hypothetical protein [Chloroflexota bacterium]
MTLDRRAGCTSPAVQDRHPIAIVGIGCRFPGGAHDPRSFWEMLRNGVDAVTEVPADRWSTRAFYHPDARVPG